MREGAQSGRVKVVKGKYTGHQGDILNWYEKTRQYEVDFGAAPAEGLRDMEFFSPEDLEEVAGQPPTTLSSSGSHESSSASDEEEPVSMGSHAPSHPKYPEGTWLYLPAKKWYVQVESCGADGVEVMNDQHHPYGWTYAYDQVQVVQMVPPGKVTNPPFPESPEGLPTLDVGKSGDVPFRQHPDHKRLEAAIRSHGFEIRWSQDLQDQHTHVVRLQEPGRTKIGDRYVEIGPSTSYSDVEHEFTHVDQQTRWARGGLGYLPTRTEFVALGTLAEGTVNEEMDNQVERGLAEIEAYSLEVVRLYARKELQTGHLTLGELAEQRLLRWIGDYLWQTNGDAEQAKVNFTLTDGPARDRRRTLFPNIEAEVRAAMKVVEVLVPGFTIKKEGIDRRL
jgi:hypothetical protein